ncbi:MAG TPA: helix-turn-helix domain-containing protein [Spirochaetota bacterium]|nr:helix-turn-helix domain-containing protein [Spirochaetota bacterium]
MTALDLMRFAAFFCLMSAAAQLVLKNRKMENYNLFLLFVLIGTILLQFYAIVSGEVKTNPYLISYHTTIFYIFCPVLYYALYAVSMPDRGFPRRFYLYFIPAIISFVFDTYLFLQDMEFKLLFVNQFFNGMNPLPVIIFRILAVGAIVQIIVYALWLIILLVPAFRGDGDKSIIYATFLFSLLSAGSSLMAVPGYIFGRSEFIMYCGISTSICIIILYLTGARNPDFLQLLTQNVKKGIYTRSLLKGVNIDEIMDQLEKLMRSDKIWDNDKLTLGDTAALLKITQHQLSQLLNERLSMNFNAYVNSFRINEAKKLLINSPDKTVLFIAYEVGFNSKSSFYESFTRLTGISPLEFRKKNLPKIK